MGLNFLFRGCSGVFASGGRCVAGLSLKRGACGIAVWKVCQRCAEGWALERGRGEVGGFAAQEHSDGFNGILGLILTFVYKIRGVCLDNKEKKRCRYITIH